MASYFFSAIFPPTTSLLTVVYGLWLKALCTCRENQDAVGIIRSKERRKEQSWFWDRLLSWPQEYSYFTAVIPNISTFERDHLLQNICRSSCPVEIWLTGASLHEFLYQANRTIICTAISCDMMMHQAVLHCIAMLPHFLLSNKDSKHCQRMAVNR